MKLLIIFIYSESEQYNKMLQIQRKYCHRDEYVYSFFVTYRMNQTEQIELEDDIVYVKGEETYLGITRKTIDAMEFLLGKLQDVDYVIRSNISTVINISELKSFCETLSKTNVYTSGGMMNELQWLDPNAGIVDETLWGTKYASGTSIIMSTDVANSLVMNKELVRHDIVDDVSIGVFMTEYFPQNYDVSPIANKVIVPFDLDESSLDKNAVFFRNRTNNFEGDIHDRERDIQNMQNIVDFVYNTKEGFIYERYNFGASNLDIASGIIFGIFAGIAVFYFSKCYKKEIKRAVKLLKGNIL